ncbi:hypothetical protein ACFZAE_20185 [Streptomyces scabiei]|uniref:hypothetical protein n=1 Tax=Streptomyces scabiei TaxID=1930 RepID=UPI0036EEA9D7
MDTPDCHRVISLVWNRDSQLSEAALKFRVFVTREPLMPHRLPDRHRARPTP